MGVEGGFLPVIDRVAGVAPPFHRAHAEEAGTTEVFAPGPTHPDRRRCLPDLSDHERVLQAGKVEVGPGLRHVLLRRPPLERVRLIRPQRDDLAEPQRAPLR